MNEKDEDKIIEEADFSQPSYSFTPPGHHDWRQQGFFLVCKSCEIQHAVFIGSQKLLVGFDKEDKPIFKKRF